MNKRASIGSNKSKTRADKSNNGKKYNSRENTDNDVILIS